MTGYRIEPTGRDDECAFRVIRLEDGVIVGFHQTRERAQAFADQGAVPFVAEPPPPVDLDQMDLFGGLRA